MDTLLPLLAFAIATTTTPGPNVLMVAAAAANHGVRATWPHILGIAVGFAFMLVVVALGLAGPFALSTSLHLAMKWAGAAWLLWLAWKIARSAAPGEGPSRPPLGFVGAALFQWVNPKAWMIALAAVPAFTTPGGDQRAEVARLAIVFLLVAIPGTLVWALFGVGARRVLRAPAALRGFNWAMAALLIASLVPMFL